MEDAVTRGEEKLAKLQKELALYKGLFGVEVVPLDAEASQLRIDVKNSKTGEYSELVAAVKTAQLPKKAVESLSVDQHARSVSRKLKGY